MSSTAGTTPRFGPVRDSKDTSRAATVLDGAEVDQHSRSQIDFKDLYFAYHGLVDDLTRWLSHERKSLTHKKSRSLLNAATGDEQAPHPPPEHSDKASERLKSLEGLEKIVAESLSFVNRARGAQASRPSLEIGGSRRRLSLAKKLTRRGTGTGAGSDTDASDFDQLVPTCEAILDNSKTLSYTSEPPVTASNLSIRSKKSSQRDKEAWDEFKREIVRLAHTLRLKGWRKVPLERGNEIKVQRLSGALTNAVYNVAVPNELMASLASQSGTDTVQPLKPPKIYGPQVEHLIDRESELSVLRRLAQRHIGPCLLGCFTNGRFEEFLHSRTLTNDDIRDPEYSKKIAKRMRELHDGVTLLESERDDGPLVWKNWDKWIDRANKIMEYVDEMSTSYISSLNAQEPGIDRSGYVTGVTWDVFRNAVDKYRKWLVEKCGGQESVRDNLVFAHNDTQYGNILRLVPAGESPLLLPANEHKQLVVIDFEYAGPNLRGLEFANHFTEWCYNYHDADKPFAVNLNNFPTQEEQRRFVKAYVEHAYVPTRPHSQFPSPVMTPVRNKSSSLITPFNLDNPLSCSQVATNDSYLEAMNNERIDALLKESTYWRPANSAMWIAWGIVQAKIPGFKLDDEQEEKIEGDGTDTGTSTNGTQVGDELADITEDGEGSLVPASARGGSDALDAEGEAAATDIHDRRPERIVLPSAEVGASGGSNGQGAATPTAGKAETEADAETEEDDEFDYLAYAHDRAMFFFGDLLALGVLEEGDLPKEVLQRVKRVKE